MKRTLANKIKQKSTYSLTFWISNMESWIWYLKKLKIELQCDLAIPLLDIYQEKTKILIQKYTYIPMFIAAIFIIATMWKETKCLSTEEWIKKVCCVCILYIYTHKHTHTHMHALEYYSAIKKNEIMQFVATWMGLEIIILRWQRKTNIKWYHLYVET